jgi:phosphatidylglycerophosphate synthase
VLLGAAWVMVRRGLWHATQMVPTRLGKYATAAQFTFLVVVLAVPAATSAVLVPTALISIAAGIDNCRAHYQKLNRGLAPEAPHQGP